MEWYPILTEGGIYDVYKGSMDSYLIIRRAEVMELSNSKAVVKA